MEYRTWVERMKEKYPGGTVAATDEVYINASFPVTVFLDTNDNPVEVFPPEKTEPFKDRLRCLHIRRRNTAKVEQMIAKLISYSVEDLGPDMDKAYSQITDGEREIVSGLEDFKAIVRWMELRK